MSQISERINDYASRYPQIENYAYYRAAIAASTTHTELDAVSDSIAATANPKHREYQMLLLAGSRRREEIAEGKLGQKAEASLF